MKGNKGNEGIQKDHRHVLLVVLRLSLSLYFPSFST